MAGVAPERRSLIGWLTCGTPDDVWVRTGGVREGSLGGGWWLRGTGVARGGRCSRLSVRDLRLPISACDQDLVRRCLSVAGNVSFFTILPRQKERTLSSKNPPKFIFPRHIIEIEDICVSGHSCKSTHVHPTLI